MTDFNELLELESQIAALEAKRDELLKSAEPTDIFRARTQGFFDAFPMVKSIGWTQYVPYFNDGDPCEWTIIGPGINPRTYEDYEAEGLGDEYEGVHEEIDMWSFEYAFIKNADSDDPYFVKKRAKYPEITTDLAPKVLSALRPIKDWLESSFNYLNKTFGHVMVVVKRDGTVSVEDFEHD